MQRSSLSNILSNIATSDMHYSSLSNILSNVATSDMHCSSLSNSLSNIAAGLLQAWTSRASGRCGAGSHLKDHSSSGSSQGSAA